MFKGDRDSSRNLTYSISDKDLTFFFFSVIFLFFSLQFSSPSSFCFCIFVNKFVIVFKQIHRGKGKSGREVIKKEKKKSFSSFNNSQKLYISQAFELVGHLNCCLLCWFDHYVPQLCKRKRATS